MLKFRFFLYVFHVKQKNSTGGIHPTRIVAPAGTDGMAEIKEANTLTKQICANMMASWTGECAKVPSE